MQVGVAQLVVVTPPVLIAVLQVCMQDGTVSVEVQLELDLDCDDVVVEDGVLSVGELSVGGPSVTGSDVQLPMEILKILTHGR